MIKANKKNWLVVPEKNFQKMTGFLIYISIHPKKGKLFFLPKNSHPRLNINFSSYIRFFLYLSEKIVLAIPAFKLHLR